MGYEIGKKVWVMGFYRDMGYPCKPSQWMSKIMGYYRLWVIKEMGYDRVDCKSITFIINLKVIVK